MMNDFLTDEKGYNERRIEVDALILDALRDGGKTAIELYRMLHENGIGNSKAGEGLVLAYSSTAAIGRSAIRSLRKRALIYDSWDTGRNYEKPFRYFRKGGELAA